MTEGSGREEGEREIDWRRCGGGHDLTELAVSRVTYSGCGLKALFHALSALSRVACGQLGQKPFVCVCVRVW